MMRDEKVNDADPNGVANGVWNQRATTVADLMAQYRESVDADWASYLQGAGYTQQSDGSSSYIATPMAGVALNGESWRWRDGEQRLRAANSNDWRKAA